MPRGDLVVAVCAHDQHVAQLALAEQMQQELGCRAIDPLQVVQEDDQRLLRRSARAQQSAKQPQQARLRLAR